MTNMSVSTVSGGRRRQAHVVFVAFLTAWLSMVVFAGSAAAQTTYYADGTCGDDAWTGTDPNCVGPDGPKATIQDAIDAAAFDEGDIIIVAPATYVENISFGGKQITVRSEDPDDPDIVATTIIDGNRAGSVVTFDGSELSSTVLSGFTITNGYGMEGAGIDGGTWANRTEATISNCIIVSNWSDGFGGGLYSCAGQITKCIISNNRAFYGGGLYTCDGDNAAISDCIITDNTAVFEGGGLYYCGGPLENCVISDNTASTAGGGVQAHSGDIIHCTVANNSANTGSGIYQCNQTITNCIAWGNSSGQVNDSSTPTYSCIQGWEGGGEGNILADPEFYLANDYHLKSTSPCKDTGRTDAGVATDADGNFRPILAGYDMGAYEYNPFSPSIAVGPGEVTLYATEGDFTSQHSSFQVANCGGLMLNWLVSASGQVANRLRFAPEPPAGDSIGEVHTIEVWADLSATGDPLDPTALAPGRYTATLTVSDPVAVNSPRTIQLKLVVGQVWHVNAVCGNDDWTGRDANCIGPDGPKFTIQAAIDVSFNDDTIIVWPGTYYENIDFAGLRITVRSYDPADAGIVAGTVIDGFEDGPVVTFAGTEGPRTVLSGFTITNGLDFYAGGIDGGDWSDHTRATITNCYIINNACEFGGGGLAYCDGAITNCFIAYNTDAHNYAGGLYDCDGDITNCTIFNNANTSAYGGGMIDCNGSITNCIIWGNSDQLYDSSTPTYSCIEDWPGGGEGNIADDPQFYVTGDYHLHPDSPCVDAGDNTAVAADLGDVDDDRDVGEPTPIDLDGNPRFVDSPLSPDTGKGTAPFVDMGAYEYNPDPASPSIAVGPAELIIHGIAGQAFSDKSQLLIANCGGGALTWSVTASDGIAANLLSNPAFDPVPPYYDSAGEIDVVEVWADLNSPDPLLYGTDYTATLTIWDPTDTAINTPRTIAVRVLINKIYLVKPEGGGDFTTIQDAIDAAIDGDTIIVYPGTYPENINFGGKQLTVRSTDPDSLGITASTIIDGGGLGSTVTFAGSEGPETVLTGFTITNGSAPGYDGGGIHGSDWGHSNTRATISNCLIIDNTSPYVGGGIAYCDGAITNCTFAGNSSMFGGALAHCLGTITNCTMTDNWADGGGGAIYLSSYGPATIVKNCRIVDNATQGDGGGIYLEDWSAQIIGCRLIDNSAAGDGAGLLLDASSPRIVGCLLAGNYTMDDGAGLYCLADADPTIIGCTFTDNLSFGVGAAIVAFGDCDLTVNSTIAYANSNLLGSEITLMDDSQLTVSYSNVEGGQGSVWIGPGCALNWLVGNIDADPLFVDADGPDDDPYTFDDNDYHITAISPCYNTGEATFTPAADDTDMDGHWRVAYSRLDIGADEYVVTGDCDYDGDVDLDDLTIFFGAMNGPDRPPGDPVADLDHDGDCDLNDFAIFAANLS